MNTYIYPESIWQIIYEFDPYVVYCKYHSGYGGDICDFSLCKISDFKKFNQYSLIVEQKLNWIKNINNGKPTMVKKSGGWDTDTYCLIHMNLNQYIALSENNLYYFRGNQKDPNHQLLILTESELSDKINDKKDKFAKYHYFKMNAFTDKRNSINLPQFDYLISQNIYIGYYYY